MDARQTQLKKAIVWMLLSALGFALMNLSVRMAGPLPLLQKSLFRNAVVLFVSLAVLARSGGCGEVFRASRLTLGSGGILILRATFGLLGVLANFYAVDHLPVADAAILNKLSPFLVILLSAILLRERPKKEQLACVALALIGAVCVVRPSFLNPNLGAYGVALLGGLSAGTAYTLMRILTLRGVNRSLIVLFFALFSSLVLLPWVWRDFVPMSPASWFWLLLAGSAAALGQYGVTYAYSYAPAKEISIFDYSQLIFAAFFGFVCFGELPSGMQLLGYVVIAGAALILYVWNLRRHD